jgi:hypothetical protein
VLLVYVLLKRQLGCIESCRYKVVCGKQGSKSGVKLAGRSEIPSIRAAVGAYSIPEPSSALGSM